MTLKEERRVVTLWEVLLSKDTAHRGYAENQLRARMCRWRSLRTSWNMSQNEEVKFG